MKYLSQKGVAKLLESTVLKSSRNALEQKIQQHHQFLKTWNEQGLEESIKQIKSQTENLNSSYQTLTGIHRKWERIKENLSAIYSYQQMIVNSICEQTSNQDNTFRECKTSQK